MRDGAPLDYCECVAKGMRRNLGPDDYPAFTEFVLLGGIDSASPQDILKLMEKFELSPGELAELRGRIRTLGDQVHRQCAP